MKRTNDKDTPSSLKKTKTDHVEFGSSTLIKPPNRISSQQRTPFSQRPPPSPPKPEPEIIMLSSDDEEDLEQQREELATSVKEAANKLSLSKSRPNTTTPIPIPQVIIADSSTSKPNTSSPKNIQKVNTVAPNTNSKINIPPTIAATTKQQPTTSSIKGKERELEPAVIIKSPHPKVVIKPDIPSASTASSTTSTETTPKPVVVKEDKPSTTEKKTTQGIDITNLDDELDDEEQVTAVIVESSSAPENKDTIAQPTPINPTTEQFKPTKTLISSTFASEELSEIDELLSDSEMGDNVESTIAHQQHGNADIVKKVVEEPVVQKPSVEKKKKEEVLQIEETDSDTTHRSFSTRPVREGRNKPKTYNDIVNSSYVSSDSDYDFVDYTTNLAAISAASSSSNRKLVKKVVDSHKAAPRSSPMRAANMLAKFTKELSSRRHLKTGFVYDTAMSYHATPNPMEIHPEDPRRIFKIFNILEQHGLLKECKRIKSRRATKQEILLAHNIVHYRKMRETAGKYIVNIRCDTSKRKREAN